jgi:hypothetical protein
VRLADKPGRTPVGESLLSTAQIRCRRSAILRLFLNGFDGSKSFMSDRVEKTGARA